MQLDINKIVDLGTQFLTLSGIIANLIYQRMIHTKVKTLMPAQATIKPMDPCQGPIVPGTGLGPVTGHSTGPGMVPCESLNPVKAKELLVVEEIMNKLPKRRHND